MENEQVTNKEYLYLIYGYISITTLLLLGISKVTKTLERALDFSSTVSLLILLNIAVFLSSYYYIKTHNKYSKQK
jgi:hypothetical protein